MQNSLVLFFTLLMSHQLSGKMKLIKVLVMTNNESENFLFAWKWDVFRGDSVWLLLERWSLKSPQIMFLLSVKWWGLQITFFKRLQSNCGGKIRELTISAACLSSQNWSKIVQNRNLCLYCCIQVKFQRSIIITRITLCAVSINILWQEWNEQAVSK